MQCELVWENWVLVITGGGRGEEGGGGRRREDGGGGQVGGCSVSGDSQGSRAKTGGRGTLEAILGEAAGAGGDGRRGQGCGRESRPGEGAGPGARSEPAVRLGLNAASAPPR